MVLLLLLAAGAAGAGADAGADACANLIVTVLASSIWKKKLVFSSGSCCNKCRKSSSTSSGRPGIGGGEGG